MNRKRDIFVHMIHDADIPFFEQRLKIQMSELVCPSLFSENCPQASVFPLLFLFFSFRNQAGQCDWHAIFFRKSNHNKISLIDQLHPAVQVADMHIYLYFD